MLQDCHSVVVSWREVCPGFGYYDAVVRPIVRETLLCALANA